MSRTTPVQKAINKATAATQLFEKALNDLDDSTELLEREAGQRRDTISVLLAEIDDIQSEISRNNVLELRLEELVR